MEKTVVEPSRITRAIPGQAPLPKPTASTGANGRARGGGGGGGEAAGKAGDAAAAAVSRHSEAELAAASDPRLLALLAQQRTDGAWPLDSRLAAALGAPLGALQAAMPAELEESLLEEGTEADATPAKSWASALVLAVLRLRHHDALHAWQPRAALAEQLPASLQRAAMEAVISLGIDRQPPPPQGQSRAAQPASGTG